MSITSVYYRGDKDNNDNFTLCDSALVKDEVRNPGGDLFEWDETVRDDCGDSVEYDKLIFDIGREYELATTEEQVEITEKLSLLLTDDNFNVCRPNEIICNDLFEKSAPSTASTDVSDEPFMSIVSPSCSDSAIELSDSTSSCSPTLSPNNSRSTLILQLLTAGGPRKRCSTEAIVVDDSIKRQKLHTSGDKPLLTTCSTSISPLTSKLAPLTVHKTVLCSSSSSGCSLSSLVEDELPKRYCVVCGDIASGMHYGASSCEACKAFFKRTVQGKIVYRCINGGACAMTKRGRKSCQACRYEKCVRMGMLKEGIRLDRHRGGQRKRQTPITLQRTGSRSLQFTECPMEKKSYSASYDDTLLRRLLLIEPSKVYARLNASQGAGDCKITAALLDLADRQLVAMTIWAKTFPGFSELSITRQMALINSSWLDIMCLAVAYRSTPFRGMLRYAEDFRGEGVGRCVSPQLENDLIKLAKRLTELELTREEHVLLKALTFLQSDDTYTDDTDPDIIDNLKDELNQSLLVYEKRCHVNGYWSRVGAVLLVLPLVTQCKQRMSEGLRVIYQSGHSIPQTLLREMINKL